MNTGDIQEPTVLTELSPNSIHLVKSRLYIEALPNTRSALLYAVSSISSGHFRQAPLPKFLPSTLPKSSPLWPSPTPSLSVLQVTASGEAIPD